MMNHVFGLVIEVRYDFVNFTHFEVLRSKWVITVKVWENKLKTFSENQACILVLSCI